MAITSGLSNGVVVSGLSPVALLSSTDDSRKEATQVTIHNTSWSAVTVTAHLALTSTTPGLSEQIYKQKINGGANVLAWAMAGGVPVNQSLFITSSSADKIICAVTYTEFTGGD